MWWGPKGQQVMIETPAQPEKRYGTSVRWATVAARQRSPDPRAQGQQPDRRTALEAALLEEKHPTGRVYVAWDDSDAHEDDEVEAVLGAAGVGRCCFTYCRAIQSPWLNTIEMCSLGPLRGRGGPLCELFPSVKGLIGAASVTSSIVRCNRCCP